MAIHSSSKIDYDALYEHLGLEVLDSRGAEDRMHCPDVQGLHAHGDRSGKFYINREKGVFNCFVCSGGTIAQLVSQIKGIDLDQAKSWLRDFSNDSLVEDDFMGRLDKLFEKKEEKVDVIPYFNEDILFQFERSHPFFAERGISEEVREACHCGYDSEHDAIILPHFWEGKLVGWQRRHLTGHPKFTNTSDFPKKSTLWGLDEAIGQPIIVESIPTALMLISENYSAIATFGASVNSTQLRYLRKFSNGIILAPDNDPPGNKWLDKFIEELGDFIPLYRVGFVEGNGADLGDLPKNLLESHLSKTISLILGKELSVIFDE